MTEHATISLDQIIAAANHTPDMSHQATVVAVLEWLILAVTELRTTDKRRQHTAALGHMRTALDYERTLLAEYRDRAGLCKIAINNLIQEIQPCSDK